MTADQSSFGPDKPRSTHTVVLYDENGNVIHTHTEAYYGNSPELDRETIEKKAFQFMERQVGPKGEVANRKLENIKALHLPNYQLKRGVKLSVDPATSKLREATSP